MLHKVLNISIGEGRVFNWHLQFSLIQGLITGVFALNELVFIKDMKGSDFQLSILLELSVLLLLITIVTTEFIRRIANKRRMLILAAAITHFPLLLLLFFPHNQMAYQQQPYFHYLFLLIFLFYYLNLVITLPIINQMLKSAYEHNNFGRLYGYASAANKLVIMIAALLFGFLLDYSNYSFVYIYPIMGIIGFLSIVLLARIPQPEEEIVKTGLWNSVRNSLIFTRNILKENKAFLHFEIGFMFYGFAFMISAAVIPLYFNEVFAMNHATYGFYKNGYNLLAILLLPFFGRLLGRIDARKFAAITFASLMFFTLVLTIAQYYKQYIEIGSVKLYYSLILAYAFYGIFAATMALLWFIGSAYFCKKEEVARYQSIHLSLTGLRAVFSFQIGILFYLSFGYAFTFLIASLSLLVAVLLMIWSFNRDYSGQESLDNL